MSKLEPPDTHCLSAAVGWLELGNRREAAAELQQIRPEFAGHPDVLEVWYAIQAEDKNWPDALKTAQALVDVEPDRASGWLNQAYALRRVPNGGLQSAWDALLPAYQKFPDEPTIPYNLACYACQLGQLDEAWSWLERAAAAGGKKRIKQMALGDADLEPLWKKVSAL